MIYFNIELGDGDVAVGIVKLNIREGEVQYGLSFKDLVHAEDIGAKIKDQKTNNFVAITVKNKESYQVLKKAVDRLGDLIEKGVDFEELANDLDNINKTLQEELSKEED